MKIVKLLLLVGGILLIIGLIKSVVENFKYFGKTDVFILFLTILENGIVDAVALIFNPFVIVCLVMAVLLFRKKTISK